jgi:choline dehydrogenase
MLAEKMADSILGNTPLQASNADVWIDPNWQNSQRKDRPKRSIQSS